MADLDRPWCDVAVAYALTARRHPHSPLVWMQLARAAIRAAFECAGTSTQAREDIAKIVSSIFARPNHIEDLASEALDQTRDEVRDD